MSDLLTAETDQAGGAGYTVLARRYRSTNFDEVVGQEHIARTLKNAIERERTAHAYLFCGTRGVGKTSMARIFAKALNATDDLAQKDAIAKAILRGEDIDVIEIDAASNTGVENVRDLIANAGLSPARCPYKIYIIDEVHMLSTPAFNALLKIMEEPPSHVKFILCTTEPHKVLATIQSRCQRFDFRNIPASRIAEHLRDVLAKEAIEAESVVVNEVARLANGSMRDGLSLLDRLIAASDGKVREDVLQATLGTPDHQITAGLVDAILGGDPAQALAAATDLLNRGTSIEQAIETLIEHLRNVMIIATCGADSELIELFGDARDAAERQAEHADAAGLVHMIALCEATSRNLRGSSIARSLFDAMIVRLAMTEQIASIPALLRREGAAAGAGKKKVDRGPVTRAALPSRQANGPADSSAKPGASQRPAGDSAAAEVKPPVSQTRRGPSQEQIEAAKADPIVRRAMELFNATIVDVRDATNKDDQESE